MFDEIKGSRKSKYNLRAIIIIAALFVIPFPTQLSPEFTIRFGDDSGAPIVGMVVQRSCSHFTYSPINSVCPEDFDDPKKTDDDGKISFTANYVWYGAASRAVRFVISHILLIAHGSVGKSIVLFPRTPEGFDSPTIDIDTNSPQHEVVIKRKSIAEPK